MADSRDFYRGTDETSESPHDAPAAQRPLTDEQFARRARYLAKAASLGQVVPDDETAENLHP
jgi:hypothetical protein